MVLRSLAEAKSLWALVDQGGVSLGTFLTNLLLARALLPSDYGVYVLIFGVALFLNNLYFALVTYPLSVRGAVAVDLELRRLTVEALCVGAVALIPLCAVILATAGIVGRLDLGPLAVLALSLWQAQETLRRGLLAHLRYISALWGDALSYLGQAALLWMLGQIVELSAGVAFLAMAVTSALAFALQARQLRLTTGPPYAVDLQVAVVRAWRTGRWILVSNVVNGLGALAFPWTLAVVRGTAATAAFQAASNAVNLTNPVMFSVGNVLLPAAARAAQERGVAGALRVSFRPILRGGILLVPYFTILALAPEWVLGLLYGPSSPYATLGDPLRLLALAYVFYYLGGMLAALLTSLQQARSVFVTQFASAAGGIVLGVPLSLWLGVTGACLGVFGMHGIRAVVGGLLLVRLRAGTNPANVDRCR